MIKYADYDFRNEEMMIDYYSAEDQCWDKDTLNQLWREHGICYDGCGIAPVKVFQQGAIPVVVIGNEDDGTIFFEKNKYGQYRHAFSPVWIDSVIAQLQEVKKRIFTGCPTNSIDLVCNHRKNDYPCDQCATCDYTDTCWDAPKEG